MLTFIGLVLIAVAIGYLGKAIIMLDFTRLNAALLALGTAVDSVATAIRNPHVDNNSQANIDAIAGKLEEISSGLSGLADEENAEDNADEASEVEPVEISEDGGVAGDSGDGTPPESTDATPDGTE